VQGLDWRDKSSDIETDHVYFHDQGYSAFNAKTDPTCDATTQRVTAANPNGFTMYNISLHDVKIERPATGEGAYVGESHYHDGVSKVCGGKNVLLLEHDVYGTWFYNDTLLNTGRDALQAGSVLKDCYIYNNYIDGFGLSKNYGQMSGIQINPGTKAVVYNNVVKNGNGFAIYSGGTGANYIHDNTIDNVGMELDGGGILTVAYTPVDKAGHRLENNTFTRVKRIGLEAYSLTYDISNTFNMLSGAQLKLNNSSVLVIKGENTKGTIQVLDSAGIKKYYLIDTDGTKIRIK
jgi:hypothetical protein